ncbi:MAG: PqqD family protein [Eubacterium sp.]|nr:PqqD family protein [Eubacterium sp.]MBR2277831.1 PqqD family protein [Eubacterium sp.]
MKIKDGFVKCKVGDNFLVVTTGDLGKENNIMIELNETSSYIWDFVADGLSVEQIVDKLVEMYGITPEKAKQDTEKIIGNMQSAGVFE